jgi:hypothetical protein
MFTRIFRENEIKVLLELGSWVGMGSTRFFLDSQDFTGMIICNDTWKGDSEELLASKSEKIDTLYETFCRNNWIYRDRIIPLRCDTLAGIAFVSIFGVFPDLIYVDANHQYGNVLAQLRLIRESFPKSIVTGDDWVVWPEVKRAVTDFAQESNLEIEVDENVWLLTER